MPGVVHGGAWQIVHGSVDDAEIFFRTVFEVEHFADAHTGVADERTARLQHDFALPHAARIHARQHLLQQVVGSGRCLVAVGNAQAAAQVDVVQGNARCLNLLHQVQHALYRLQIRGGFGNLRADVQINAHHAQPRQAGGLPVGSQYLGVGNAELVACKACRNIGVRFGIHIRIDANAYGRGLAQFLRDGVECFQLGQAFHIEAANANLQRQAHFGTGFAHAGKDDGFRLGTRQQRPLDFAAGYRIEAAASLRKGLHHGQGGIGFHRIANQCVASLQAALVGSQSREHGVLRINEQRRAVLLRQF